MFKNTSESLNHIARVASASTRPRANGRIDLIPQDAREPEEYYNSIRDQYVALNAELRATQDKLADLNKRLKVTMPFPLFQRLSAEKDRLGERFREIEAECRDLRPIVRASGLEAWTAVFFEIARRVLDRETFVKVNKQVEEILERPTFEVTKGEGELSEQRRASMQNGDRRAGRRKRFRDAASYRAHKAALTTGDST